MTLRSAGEIAWVMAFVSFAMLPDTRVRAQTPTREQAALVIDGVVREVFRSPRSDQVDILLQIEVNRADLGKSPREPVRVLAPAPGDVVYVHATQRPGKEHPTIPAERTRVRAYLVPRPGGGWDATPSDGFELTSATRAPAGPADPPPPLTTETTTPGVTPPATSPETRSTAATALGMSADPIMTGGKFALRVKSVERGGPAQKAGLEPGDVIVGANGRMLTGANALDTAVAEGGPLELVVLDVNSGKAARVGVDLGSARVRKDGTVTRRDPSDVETPRPPAPRRSLGFSAEPVAVGSRTGMKVTGVDPGSLAQKAGLEPGDVIVAVNGVPVTNVETLSGALRKGGPHLSLTVRDTRTGRDTPVPIELTGDDVKAPNQPTAPNEPNAAPAGAGQRLGVVGEVIFFNAESAVKITEVERDSPADRAGLRVGTVIVEADGTPILHPNTLNEVVAKSRGKLRLVTVDPKTNRQANVEVDLSGR